MKNFFNLIIGFGLIGFMFYGLYRLLSWLYSLVFSVDPTISAALITGLLAIIAASLTSTLTKYLEKRMDIDEHLRDKKSETYRGIVSLFFKILLGEKTGEKMNDTEIIAEMSKFTENLILWGSEDVIKAYKDFRIHFSNREQGAEVALQEMLLMENLLLAIRKDMGHKNNRLEKGDVLSLFINDFNKIKAVK